MTYWNRTALSALSVTSFLFFYSASSPAQNAKPDGANATQGDSAGISAPPSAEQPQAVAGDAASGASTSPAPTEAAPSPGTTGTVAAPGAAAEQPPGGISNAERAPQDNGPQTLAASAPSADASPQGRNARVHDGFYLRMALGTGTATVKLRDAPEGLDYAIEQAGWLDVMVGGTPRRGIAVGGGLWASGFSTEEWRGENNDRGSGVIFGIGPFIDYFPDPDGGFHLGGTVGIGGLQIDAEPFTNDDERMASGSAVGAWLGYDVTVYRQWSLGVEARYLGVRAKHPRDDWKGTGDCFGLSLTGLYY
jgi:hypothetical protein